MTADKTADVTAGVAAYAGTLDAALHGPRRDKDRLVAEIVDGLRCAVEEHRAAGADPSTALGRAIEELGRPDELVPACQRELTVRQTRATARALVLATLALLVGWHLVWTGAPAGVGRSVALVLAGVANASALVAGATLLLTGRTGRSLRAPTWLPAVVAWSASAGAVLALATTGVLAVTSRAVVPVLLAVVVGLVAHAVVARSARACRRAAGAVEDGAFLSYQVSDDASLT